MSGRGAPSSCLLTGVITFSSCSDDDDEKEKKDSAQVTAIANLSKQYVENVVYPTYTNLANATGELYDKLEAAKAAYRQGTLKQEDIEE